MTKKRPQQNCILHFFFAHSHSTHSILADKIKQRQCASILRIVRDGDTSAMARDRYRQSSNALNWFSTCKCTLPIPRERDNCRSFAPKRRLHSLFSSFIIALHLFCSFVLSFTLHNRVHLFVCFSLFIIVFNSLFRLFVFAEGSIARPKSRRQEIPDSQSL